MIMQHKEPIVVNEQLERQKEAIFQLFKSKDEMTERCQKELKRNTIDNGREKFQDESNRKWRDPYIALTVTEQENQEIDEEEQQFYANKFFAVDHANNCDYINE
ncbi:hypothetical protein GQX74_005746 [Glossina fuscipes]|nr:hypothetical protein GQX74_005746 [Glossina fuscipes]